jgi:hypothetical protein
MEDLDDYINGEDYIKLWNCIAFAPESNEQVIVRVFMGGVNGNQVAPFQIYLTCKIHFLEHLYVFTSFGTNS